MSEPLRVRTFPRRIEAVTALLDWVEDCVRDQAIDGGLADDLMLVIEELFTNHVRHQPVSLEPIEIALRVEANGGVSVDIVDPRAEHFDPRTGIAPAMDVPGREHGEGGRGLFLVRQLASRLDYEFENGVALTRVTLDPRGSGSRP